MAVLATRSLWRGGDGASPYREAIAPTDARLAVAEALHDPSAVNRTFYVDRVGGIDLALFRSP